MAITTTEPTVSTSQQTCLEKTGIDSRHDSLVRNDYTRNDEYTEMHPDALSTGDPQGKGTGNGGHMHSIPDCNAPTGISYANFNTNGGGGSYDIDGRDGVGGRVFLQNISKYNANHEYGPNSIDTSLNVADGQIVV